MGTYILPSQIRWWISGETKPGTSVVEMAYEGEKNIVVPIHTEQHNIIARAHALFAVFI